MEANGTQGISRLHHGDWRRFVACILREMSPFAPTCFPSAAQWFVRQIFFKICKPLDLLNSSAKSRKIFAGNFAIRVAVV
jgi:hypothetical protein